MTRPGRWQEGWAEACQADLVAAMVAVVDRLPPGDEPDAPDAPGGMLERIASGFSLTPGEVDLLVLAAAAELDPTAVSGQPRPCCGQVLSVADAIERLDRTGWDALSPSGPLRRWRLVATSESDPVHGACKIDERALFALLGVHSIDPVLQARGRPLPPVDAADRLPSLVAAAAEATRRWAGPSPAGVAVPVLEVTCADLGAARRVCQLAAEQLGLDLWELAGSALPTSPEELDSLAVVLERDAVLADVAALLIDDDADAGTQRCLGRLIERCSAPLAVIGGGRRRQWQRPTSRVEVAAPPVEERAALWRAALGPMAPALHTELDRLASSFALPVDRMHEVAAATSFAVAAGDAPVPSLWRSARQSARGALDGLAPRVDSPAGWADLVLPAPQQQMLAEISAHVRHRHLVGREWGFAAARGDSLGVTALFHGPSGVGKTLAARVLATELDLDLYRVDLSQTVSKYVGETEKNLKEIFDRAEHCNAVLVFDEADALFGKRSDVHDARDRYANIEVSYLLQRMESYGGLAILTTNLPANLDPAFIRRLRHSIAFPFPDQAARRDIWSRVFPARAPLAELDLGLLARLGVSGAAIANIALGAAVLAAEAATPITMGHLRLAAKSEYAKHDRVLSTGELLGWPDTEAAHA